MRAAYINQTGPAENIIIGELPDPQPATGQVLVAVRAASVNPIDTYIRSGVAAPPNLPLPFIVGSDLAGVVKAVGPNATQFRVGDRVWGANQGVLGRQGTFSELAAIDERWLYPTPDGVTDEAGRRHGPGRHHRPPGPGRRSQTRSRRNHARQRRQRRRRLHRHSNGQGARRHASSPPPAARRRPSTAARSAPTTCSTTAPTTSPSRVAEIIPDGAHVWWETSREPNFDTAVACLGRRGRIVLMAGRSARPEFPVGPFYTKVLPHVRLRDVPRRAGSRSAAPPSDINRWMASGALKAKIDRVARSTKRQNSTGFKSKTRSTRQAWSAGSWW